MLPQVTRNPRLLAAIAYPLMVCAVLGCGANKNQTNAAGYSGEDVVRSAVSSNTDLLTIAAQEMADGYGLQYFHQITPCAPNNPSDLCQLIPVATLTDDQQTDLDSFLSPPADQQHNLQRFLHVLRYRRAPATFDHLYDLTPLPLFVGPHGVPALTSFTRSTLQDSDLPPTYRIHFNLEEMLTIATTPAKVGRSVLHEAGHVVAMMAGHPINDYLSFLNFDSGLSFLETFAGKFTWFAYQHANYRDAVMADRPAGYWRLGTADSGTHIAHDEMGTAADDNNGTYRGARAFTDAGLLDGDPDTAVKFSSSGNCAAPVESTVSLPTITGIDTGTSGAATTVEFLMKWDGTFGTDRSPIPFGFNYWALTFHVPTQAGGTLAFGFTTANNGDVLGIDADHALAADGTTYSLTNQVVHVVAIFKNKDASNNVLYLNGVKQNDPTSGQLSKMVGVPYNNRVVSVNANISGWPSNGCRRFPGILDEVAVYPRAFDDAMALAHYKLAIGAYVAGLQ